MIDVEKFTKTWQTAETIEQVSVIMKKSKSQCSSYATFLKSKGVKLRLFRRSNRHDYKALAKFAEDCLK